MAVHKLIVSNLGALNGKYGAGLADVQNAVNALIAADRNAGITSGLLYLDDAAAMGALGTPPVTSPKSDKQNKDAVDGAIKYINNMLKLFQLGSGVIDHLLLLGSEDIIPQQKLTNPFPDYDGGSIASDLPYACGSPYSQDIHAFLAPTRSVGRLPDLTGTADKGYFVDVITGAANRVTHPPSLFRDYFAVSSSDMQSRTDLTLNNLFGNADCEVCPPDGCPGVATCPQSQTCPGPGCPAGGLGWTAAQMAAHTHYFNFHGVPLSAASLGRSGDGNTVAMHAAMVPNLSPGMIAVNAGCYGAELYNPGNMDDASGHPGLCNTYLQNGCAAYFGSSSRTYGRPMSHNDNSDFIAQFFLEHLLQGRSSGQACLQARQHFISESQLKPKALKALAQFSLMGDPSLRPVKPPMLMPPWKLPPQMKEVPFPWPGPEPKAREWCEPLPHARALSAEVERKIKEIAARHPGVVPGINSFQVRRSEGFEPDAGAPRPTHVHAVCFNLVEELAGSPGMHLRRSLVYEILEADGKVLDIDAQHSK